jgi:hypothetical protein
MHAHLLTVPGQSWLTCPTSSEQTDAYWQAVTQWRCVGIELVLCAVRDGQEPPWAQLQNPSPWHGLVLWPDAQGQSLSQLAHKRGIDVRCLGADPALGLQPWSGA